MNLQTVLLHQQQPSQHGHQQQHHHHHQQQQYQPHMTMMPLPMDSMLVPVDLHVYPRSVALDPAFQEQCAHIVRSVIALFSFSAPPPPPLSSFSADSLHPQQSNHLSSFTSSSSSSLSSLSSSSHSSRVSALSFSPGTMGDSSSSLPHSQHQQQQQYYQPLNHSQSSPSMRMLSVPLPDTGSSDSTEAYLAAHMPLVPSVLASPSFASLVSAARMYGALTLVRPPGAFVWVDAPAFVSLCGVAPGSVQAHSLLTEDTMDDVYRKHFEASSKPHIDVYHLECAVRSSLGPRRILLTTGLVRDADGVERLTLTLNTLISGSSSSHSGSVSPLSNGST
jgi:hypothetical protein